MQIETRGSRWLRGAKAILLLSVLATLFACPPPVSDQLATVVGDKLPPTLTVTSPKIGQTYTAEVTFTGTVSDDASSAGDGKGTVKSIDYSVASYSTLKGKILINGDGSSQQVSSYGPGAITWTAASKTFTFTFSTVTPSPLHGPLSVTVDATDANNNVTTQVVQLSEGAGPVITMTSPSSAVPASLKYTAGSTTVTISGTVANASDDASSASNISTISWAVIGKSWGGSIDIVAGPLSTLNHGFAVNQSFTYTPATRTFDTSFVVPFLNDTTLILTVTATDLNGHSTTSQTVLVADVSGPEVALNTVLTSHYYSSNAGAPKPTIVGQVTSTVANVKAVTYQVTAGAFSSGAVTVYSSTGGPSGFFDGSGNFSFSLSDPSASLTGRTGTATATITFADQNNVTTIVPVTLVEDSTGPVVSSVSLASVATANTAYAKIGDTVKLLFHAVDAGIGMTSTPTVQIEGKTETVTPLGSGDFSATHVMLSTDTSDANVSFTITATDDISNVTTQSTSATNVMFYANAPTFTSVTMRSTTNPSPTWAKNTDTVELAFDTTRDLSVVPSVTLAGRSPAAAPASLTAHSYTATTAMNPATDSDGPITFSVTITDAAGNTPATVNAVTSGSAVTYDKTPPTGYSVTTTPYVNIASAGVMSFTVNLAAAEGAGSSYTYFVSDGVHSTTSTTKPMSATWSTDTQTVNVSALNEGPLTVYVTVTDAAGNQGASPATATTKKDTVAPTAFTIAAPTYVNLLSSGLLGFTLTLGSAETDGSYSYYVTDAASHTTPTVDRPMSGSWTTDAAQSVNVSGLDDGTLTIHLTVTDAAGNPRAQTQTTIKDTSAPTGYSVGVSAYVQNSVSFTVILGVAETGGSYAYSVTDGTNTYGPTTVNKTGSWSTDTPTAVNVTTWNQGTLTITVTVTDAAGNTGAPASTTTTRDTVAPSGYSVSTSTYVQNSVSFTVTLGAAETGGSYTYSVTDGTNTYGPTTVNKTGSWSTDTPASVNVTGWNQGTLTINVTVTDAAGNTGAPASTTTTRDTVAPNFSISAGAYVGDSLPFSFTLTAAEADGSYSYNVTDSGSGSTSTVNVPKSGSWSSDSATVDVSSLAQGTLTIHVTVTDAAGNPRTLTKTTIRDTQAPTGYSISASAYVQNSVSFTVNLGAAETDGSYVYTVTDGTHSIGPTTVNKTGSWSSDTVTGLNVSSFNQGTVTITVKVTDAAGNPGSDATTTTNRDTQAPTGYSVSTATYVNKYTQSAMSFTVTLGAAETDGSYAYSITDGTHSIGPTTVTKTGSWSSDTPASVDVTGWNETTLTISVTVTDAAGNAGSPASTTTTKDTQPPSISSILQTGTNTALDVNFDTAVYGPSSASALDPASATFNDDTPPKTSGTASGSVTMSNGNKTAVYSVTWSGSGPTTGDTIIVNVAAGSIYDAAGNDMTAASYTFAAAAKALMIAGGSGGGSASTGARRATFLGRVQSFMETTLGGSNSGTAAPAATTVRQTTVSGIEARPSALPEEAMTALRTAVPANPDTATSVGPEPSRASHSSGSVLFTDMPSVPAAPPSRATSMAPGTNASVVDPTPEMPTAAAAAPTDQGSSLPAGWALGLGALALGLVGGGAWIGLRLLSGKASRG